LFHYPTCLGFAHPDVLQVAADKLNKMEGYENKDEYKTIQEVNSVARSMPATQFEASDRSDHYGQTFRAIGVTSTFVPPKNPVTIDKTRTPIVQ
jgi:hypothetical protein